MLSFQESNDQGINEQSGAARAYEPTEAEQKTLKLVEKLLKKGQKHKKQYSERWLDYYKMFRGKQWFTDRPDFRSSEVINLIFQLIQSQVPIMTDSRPTIVFLPTEASDQPFAELLTKLFDFDWETNSWDEELLEIIYDANFYGLGIGTIDFDARANNNLGSMIFSSFDPFYFIPDPNAKDCNKDAQWIITAVPTDVECVKRDNPDKAQFIKADIGGFWENEKTDIGHLKFRSPTDSNVLLEGSAISDDWARDKTLVVTLYIKDSEVLEEEVAKEDGSKAFSRRLKYPLGRKIVKAGNVILADEPMDGDDGKFPFARLVNYTLPREFWGMSEIEQMESPQKLFNKLISFSMDVLTLMGNPVWIVDTSSGIDTEAIINQPGAILEPEPGSRVERVEGVQLQPFVLNMITMLEGWFNKVSGDMEVTRGTRPEGVTAARAIESLQEASLSRLRLKMRNMDRFLRQIGSMYAVRALQYYTVPRVVRITNDQGAEQFFSFHVEHSGEEKTARLREVRGDGTMGEENAFKVSGQIDARAATESGLPFAKADRERRYLAMFDRGIIDPETLLKGIEFPNAEIVIERLKTQQIQQPVK